MTHYVSYVTYNEKLWLEQLEFRKRCFHLKITPSWTNHIPISHRHWKLSLDTSAHLSLTSSERIPTLSAHDWQCFRGRLRPPVDEFFASFSWHVHGHWAVPNPSLSQPPVSTTSTQNHKSVCQHVTQQNASRFIHLCFVHTVRLTRVCGLSLQPIGCTSALACDVQRYCSCRLRRFISAMHLQPVTKLILTRRRGQQRNTK